MRAMSLAPSAQLKECLYVEKKMDPAEKGVHVHQGHGLFPGHLLRETARFTAVVVAPTPPLLPITLMRMPFFSFAFSGPSASMLFLISSREAMTSSLLIGWGKNSFTPVFNAFKRTSGSLLEEVRKTSLARPFALDVFYELELLIKVMAYFHDHDVAGSAVAADGETRDRRNGLFQVKRGCGIFYVQFDGYLFFRHFTDSLRSIAPGLVYAQRSPRCKSSAGAIDNAVADNLGADHLCVRGAGN